MGKKNDVYQLNLNWDTYKKIMSEDLPLRDVKFTKKAGDWGGKEGWSGTIDYYFDVYVRTEYGGNTYIMAKFLYAKGYFGKKKLKTGPLAEETASGSINKWFMVDESAYLELVTDYDLSSELTKTIKG